MVSVVVVVVVCLEEPDIPPVDLGIQRVGCDIPLPGLPIFAWIGRHSANLPSWGHATIQAGGTARPTVIDDIPANGGRQHATFPFGYRHHTARAAQLRRAGITHRTLEPSLILHHHGPASPRLKEACRW